MTTQMKSKIREMLPGLIAIAGCIVILSCSLVQHYVLVDYYQDKNAAMVKFKKIKSGYPYYLLRTEDNKYYISKYAEEDTSRIDAINQGGVIYYKEGN